jgi:hypothetical protein
MVADDNYYQPCPRLPGRLRFFHSSLLLCLHTCFRPVIGIGIVANGWQSKDCGKAGILFSNFNQDQEAGNEKTMVGDCGHWAAGCGIKRHGGHHRDERWLQAEWQGAQD